MEVYIIGRNTTNGNDGYYTGHFGSLNPVTTDESKKIPIRPHNLLAADIKRNDFYLRLRNVKSNVVTQLIHMKRYKQIP